MVEDILQYFLFKNDALITDGLCMSFGGAPKPASQGRQRELNILSSFAD